MCLIDDHHFVFTIFTECCEEWKLKLKSSEDTCEVLRKNAQKIKERIVDSSWILNQFKQGQ